MAVEALITDTAGNEACFFEGETAKVSVQLKDEDGTNLSAGNAITATCTLYGPDDSIINSRNAANILDATIGTVEGDGTISLRFTTADNPIVGSLADLQSEIHRMLIAWTWNDGVNVRTRKQFFRYRVAKVI